MLPAPVVEETREEFDTLKDVASGIAMMLFLVALGFWLSVFGGSLP